MLYYGQMSERYTLYQIENLRDRFTLPHGVPQGVKKSYNISPTQLHPVVITNDEGVVEMKRMKWGFVPHRAKDTHGVFRYKTFDAKSEDVFEKVTWQHAIRHSRCLIPANGYYEWQQTPDGKRPFYITTKDQELFAMAGIYSSWTDPDGVEWGTYAVVTVVSNLEMATINPRMPVILRPEDEATWLDPTVDDYSSLYDCMRTYPDGMLQIKLANPEVKSPKINRPELIVPLARQ